MGCKSVLSVFSFPRAVLHASGVSPLCDDAHAACLVRSASSISSHSLLEEELSHTFSLPNYQEDVSLFREILENLGHSRSAEKHVHIVLAS